jgi:hypothetical protein
MHFRVRKGQFCSHSHNLQHKQPTPTRSHTSRNSLKVLELRQIFPASRARVPAPPVSFYRKSSQVKFKMAVANPPPLVPIAGASDREGRFWRNRHHWIALSRGIIPIFFFLIKIAAPRGFNIEPFSGSLQYGNATRLQADDGSDRGPARGLFRWAKASVGSGDRRRRASSARCPSPTVRRVLVFLA